MRHTQLRPTVRWSILLLLLALAAGPQTADAAKGGKAAVIKAADINTVGTSDSPHSGDLDPTTVPIIDEDLLFSVAATQDQMQAGDAHAFATGAGVVIAVLDGGFNLNHPAIAGNLLDRGYDAVDGDYDVNDLGDGLDNDGDGVADYAVGHGTFVIGMVLEAAPDALIVPIRIRTDEGYGSDEVTMKGLEYARFIGADIVNFSGATARATSSKLQRSFEAAATDGITVIVAAGNDGHDGVDKLAKNGSAMGVAAVDRYDRLAPWSNYTPYAVPRVLCAPGVDLYGPIGAPYDDASGYWSGTSFAAGLASGAAALVLEVFPEFTPQDVYARLEATCDPAWDRYGALMPTGGRINLYRAVTQ